MLEHDAHLIVIIIIINFTTEDDDTMEAMNEDDMCRYLGHMQAKQIKHA